MSWPFADLLKLLAVSKCDLVVPESTSVKGMLVLPQALSAFCRAEDVGNVVREGVMEALRCRGKVKRERSVCRLQLERREPKNQRKELGRYS
jgi:hypothetical protein